LVITPGGEEISTSYVTKNGVVIAASCPASPIIAPVGGPFPPTTATGAPEGFDISFVVVEGGKTETLSVQVSKLHVVAGGPSLGNVYFRWTGIIVGGIVGIAEQYEGVALFEQFSLLP